mgnify:CR=1 FL=1
MAGIGNYVNLDPRPAQLGAYRDPDIDLAVPFAASAANIVALQAGL